MILPITIDEQRVADFCKTYHITRLSFFGSVLTDRFRTDSDVDVLVEFDPENTPGLLGLAGMELELSELLGHKTDIRTAQDLSQYFREDVVRNALVQYAA